LDNVSQFYIDTSTPMLNSDGKPIGDLFVSDSLHLSEKGYDLWSQNLGPILDSIINEKRLNIFD